MAQVKFLKIANNLPTEHTGSADDLTVLSLSTDTINEQSGAAGVTVDSVVLKDGGINLAASSNYQINGVDIVADTAGTATLSNIDALDATTESTIELAIDTLANLTSAITLATVGTITTGTWTATDIEVASGGTSRSSATAYAVLCGGTTSTGAHQSIAGVGTSGQILTSNGAGALPTFQAAGAASDSETYTNGNAASIVLGDVVYLESGVNDTVELADADVVAHGEQLVGIAAETITASSTGSIHVTRGKVIAAVITGATAGDIYYLSTTGTSTNTLTNTAPSGGPALVRVGVAKNATDLIFDPEFIADTTA